ncbi:MAG: hypothetical protein V3T84_10615 [Phycisphaerales bacterium]
MKTMMTRKGSKVFPITAGVLGSLALAVSASGQFLLVTIEDFDAGAPEGFRTFRVVAHFGGADIMLFWGAFPGEGDLIFFTCNSVDLLNDTASPFSGLKAEDFATFPISAEWDSWVTVGTTGFAGNQTDYTPGFIGSDGVNAAIVGNSFSDVEGFVFDADPTSPISGPDVVMAQFTIPEGNSFHLQGVVGWNPPNGGPGFNLSSFLVEQKCPPSCPWDLDDNAVVGASDLLSLLVSWGPCKGCPADFDGNGNVEESDLAALLANWGPCP